MAGQANIEAALNNGGSDACWTIPNEVEWNQGGVTGRAPLIEGLPFTVLSDYARGVLETMQTQGEAAPTDEVTSAEGTPANVRSIETAKKRSPGPAQLSRVGHAAVTRAKANSSAV